ncbi:MarR family winged helix-turn-helix transcriptional regulator [Belliella marina]|uniref:MarR family winged helix-turn-helix transcriptional regulator n=1 Tax=Belliella marina TaxID=1644146 RepID=A0ABW4VIS2_9BACT
MNDFLIEMGVTGLTGRLKRLNDLFVYQTRQFYEEQGVDIEPNWHMIFLLLEKHGSLTVTEIADAIQISHPAVIKLTHKMKKNGYVKSIRNPDDLRKQQLELTKKAHETLPQLKKYWDAGEKSLNDLLEHNQELMIQLVKLEENLKELGFKDRMDNYSKNITQ